MSLYNHTRLTLNPLFRMQYEQAQGCHVLLYPEGMVSLSDSAAEILTCFAHEKRLADVIVLIESRYPGIALQEDIIEFVEIAYEKHWLKSC
ncbi:pyrroloquinoline quinone biosynthesis peptide chaperone PqqD [Vibrio sp. RC586]|uniref:pyrroloquinoline quinone biosynthesis peptide chaperone PqqD n=1 Tax=Vibrio sp. RC586 TaxID=675815 RepID=UPI0002D55C8F|nr:pyrroloquinoline quinone biosynthesis peptide chaperone PqqD [Vibrio sp. RC586]